MFNKKAESGIGTLIVFIAMILVAAIAASVFIQTATSLQNKALLTGSRTKGQVSTGLTTLLLYATNGSDSTIEHFRQKVKLSPGSDPIALFDALIEFGTESTSGDYIYSDETCVNATNAAGTGYFFDNANSNGTFTVKYLVKGANYQAGYLVRGDIAMLCYEAPAPLDEDTTLLINLIPKVGTPMQVETATPNIMTAERIYLFP